MNNINKEEFKEKLLKAINQVSQMGTVFRNDVVLMVNTKDQEKMFQENLPKEALPYVHILCADGRLESDDKCYIMPVEEKPIKIIYE